MENENYKIASRERLSLALNKLNNWYMLKDEEVKPLVLQMKQELSDKKYEPYEFKNIIVLLMQINNPYFGMNSDNDVKSSGDAVYESC